MPQSMLQYVQGPHAVLLISGIVFVGTVVFALAVGFLLLPVLQTRSAIRDELAKAGINDVRSMRAQTEIRRIGAKRPVEAYFKAVERETARPDALELKLFQAGFYRDNAIIVFNVIRVGMVGVAFILIYMVAVWMAPPSVPGVVVAFTSGLIALAFMAVPNVALDYYAKRIKETYRRGFPDFMDMMTTCADAGMSLEAAVERVSDEMAVTHRDLGIQLAVMTLQLRVGKPLREALTDLANRIGIEEARALAVLFRQSEELGTSLTGALRVYSDEMRDQRILRAEEKANSLPVRMMIPLGLCVFPLILMIIMLPVIIRMKVIFTLH